MTSARQPPPAPAPLPPALDQVGDGVPLLLLHAFPLSRRMWRPQLAGLADACRLLAPDLPGFGGSAPLPAAVCSMEDMAGAALGVLDALGLPSAVVCGLSMGGYVALALCERCPERVRGLVLADTRATADDAAGRQRRLAAALEAESRGPAALADTLVPRLLSARTREERPELVAWLRREIAAAPAAGFAAAQRGMAARPDRTALLRRLAMPALVVVGEEDELTPPAHSVELARQIPGARLVTIAGAGHLSNLEQPEAFNGAMRDFMRDFRKKVPS